MGRSKIVGALLRMPLQVMNYVLAVAEQGSVSSAALCVNLTASALGRQIHQLEHEYPMTSEFLRNYREVFTDPESAYSTSMLRDIERGEKTEGEHILGYVLREAITYGIRSPVPRPVRQPSTGVRGFARSRAHRQCRRTRPGLFARSDPWTGSGPFTRSASAGAYADRRFHDLDGHGRVFRRQLQCVTASLLHRTLKWSPCSIRGQTSCSSLQLTVSIK